MKKLSIIRGDTTENCPFGLPIISACASVGDVIAQMEVLPSVDGEEYEIIKKNNKIIFFTQKLNNRCPFANSIMKTFNKVDCSYGDSAAGDGIVYLPSSPLYPRTFIGDGMEPGTPNKGQDIYDPRLYYDAPERDIDVPFGLFSIFANVHNEDRLLKIAQEYTNKNTNIKEKIAKLRDKYFDILKLVVAANEIVIMNDKHLEQLLIVINDWVDG